MKSVILIPALITSAFVAGQASALEFGGANFEIAYTAQSDDFSDSQEFISGSAEVLFGGSFGVQLDVASTTYDGFANDGATAFGGHVFYELSPTVVLGAYYVSEDWGNVWNSYGVEAVFDAGKITYEIAIGAYQESGEDAYFNFNATAAYHVTERIDITAGALVSYWGEFGDSDDAYNDFNIGGRYTFNNGLYVNAAYNILAYSGDSDQSISLGLGFDFGGGVTFSQRAYAALYSGD